MANQEQSPQKEEEKQDGEEKERRIVILFSKNSIRLSEEESQHASVFELLAVINALVQTYNVKEEVKQ